MYILGGLNDQILLLVFSKIHTYMGDFLLYAPYRKSFLWIVYPYLNNEPITWIVTNQLLKLFGYYGMYVLLAITLVLAITLSINLFKGYKYTFFYTTAFIFNSYMWTHLGIHLSLTMTFCLLPTFIILNKIKEEIEIKEVLLIAILNTLAVLISNYLGFFLILFSYLYLLFFSVFNKNNFKTNILRLILGILLNIVILSAPLYNYIQINYITNNNTEKYIEKKVERPYEDFFTFSWRPWYLFIPPVQNPLLGGIGTYAVEKIKETNYYLTDDYFPVEHQGSYFGMVLWGLLVYTMYKRIKIDANSIYNKEFLFLFTSIIFMLFALPPYISIGGTKIYTPGQLIYLITPMFRTTARMVTIFQLAILITIAKNITFLINKNYLKEKILNIVFPVLTIILILETFVPIKIQVLETPPQVYTYIQKNIPAYTEFAVYPYSKTQEALFWLDIHKGYLINMRGYKNPEYDSENLTKNLVSEEGFNKLKTLDTQYLVVFEPTEQELYILRENLLEVYKNEKEYLYKIQK